MNKIDSTDYRWQLVAYDNEKQVVAYPVPNAVIGDVIKILFEEGKGETCSPTKEISNELNNILGKQINEDIIARLTGLSEEYIKQLINGVVEPEKTKNIISLTEVLAKIR